MAEKTIRERVIEGLGGSASADDARFQELREQVHAERLNNDLLAESFAQLELALEEQGWRRFGSAYQQEFTRGALENLIQISQMMYMVNPLIKRAVNVKTYYTWGQGVEVEAKEDKIDEIVGPLMEDDGNRAEFFAHQSRILTHIDQQLEGNVFFRMPTDLLGNVTVRSIPTNEIRDIHTKPGDPQQIWFYRRVWNEQVFDLATGETSIIQYDKLYPDYRYDPVSKPATIGDKEVMWFEPIIHQKTGGLKHMQFGIPETYAALDWARAYKRFLEDWHTIVKSLSEFAWKRTTTAEKMQGEKKKFEARRKPPAEAEEASENGDPLRRRAAGSVAITTDKDDFAPIPKSGATVNSDDARPSRLMVASAMDLPDTILSGDVDIGNFATSKTLDRPTELAMVNEQLMWKRFEQEIYNYAIKAKIRHGMLKGTRKRSIDGRLWITEYTGDAKITIKYPPVLEHDIKEVVGAMVTAATLDGRQYAGTLPREELSRQLMNALGWENIDDLVKELPPEEQVNLQAAVDALKAAAGPAPEQPAPGDKPPEKPAPKT